MPEAQVRFVGTYPLLLQSDRTVNPFDPLTKRLRSYTSKRKKTDDDLLAISRYEWETALYFDDDIGPYVPGENLLACIADGGAVTRSLTRVKESVVVTTDKVPLEYEGPRDIEGLWNDPSFRLVKSVAVNRKRVMRTRPRFEAGWTLNFTVDFDASSLAEDELRRAVVDAGLRKGLGDYRPIYGRFRGTVNGR